MLQRRCLIVYSGRNTCLWRVYHLRSWHLPVTVSQCSCYRALFPKEFPYNCTLFRIQPRLSVYLFFFLDTISLLQ
jgi:hypothetical protein